MKASETSLRNLLEGGKQFRIPLFQRPYSWGETNWETLWQDLMSLYQGEVEGFYFLGPIVTQAILGTAEGISPFVVIDGQQRLTTLSILLAALRNHLKRQKNALADELYELYLINRFKSNDDYYKVLPTQDDREVYKKIIQDKEKDIKEKSRIYDAYKFFKNRLKERNPEDNEIDSVKLKKVILESLVLVNITSDKEDNPYLIFESLNNKGEELTQVDLVRNYIFMRLPGDHQEKVYKDIWLPLQEQFKINAKQNNYTEELTRSLWYYLRKDGEKVNERSIYQELKKRFDKPNVDIKVELEKLSKFAIYYQRFVFPDTETEPRLKYRFNRLLQLDFTTSHIFLLNVYYEYDTGHLSLNNFENILRYLESYFVRRYIAGISTKVLGDVFNKLYVQIQEKNSGDLVTALHTVLIGYSENRAWPEDDVFRQAIINKAVYSKSSIERVRLLLEGIETSLSKERVEPQNLTIEHIMPQTPSKEWRSMLGTNFSNIHKRWLHTLANLTLTGYNSELSNKPFDKKLSYLKSSNVSMNQYFREVEIWNEEAMQRRAEYLADIAVKVWPR